MNKTDPHPVNLVNPVERLSEFYSNFCGLMAYWRRDSALRRSMENVEHAMGCTLPRSDGMCVSKIKKLQPGCCFWPCSSSGEIELAK
jgi:hypothetical protein